HPCAAVGLPSRYRGAATVFQQRLPHEQRVRLPQQRQHHRCLVTSGGYDTPPVAPHAEQTAIAPCLAQEILETPLATLVHGAFNALGVKHSGSVVLKVGSNQRL